MSAETGAVVAVRMPQVNVNDEEVALMAWRVEDGGRVVEGQPLCEIETSKAAGELPSPASGILRHAAKAGDMVRTDSVVAYIGPSAAVIDSYVSSLHFLDAPAHPGAARAPAETTAGAVELARRAGIDLARVPAAEGRLRRSDVEKYLAQHGAAVSPAGSPPSPPRDPFAVADAVIPAALADSVTEVEPLSSHDWAISQHLKETQARLVVAHAAMDVDMRKAADWMDRCRQAGRMASPLPVLIKAAVAAVAACPKLIGFRIGRRVFRYRSLDVAFTARSHQGWLYTPVVRAVDSLSLDELAGICSELAMGAFRGQLAEKDLAGGCITVSLLNEQPIRLHVGLQNVYQSAIITSGAVRDEIRLIDGRPVAVPTLTLAMSYDHGIMDGWDAATALDAARRAVENWTL
jgi:pyruvate/2-oxoglutarate dehydrogenase complex dihydrolipoamide acyltransferase (E2) component